MTFERIRLWHLILEMKLSQAIPLLTFKLKKQDFHLELPYLIIYSLYIGERIKQGIITQTLPSTYAHITLANDSL